MDASISIFGAGAWGTALALSLANNHSQVVLWSHSPTQVQTLQQTRQNSRYLPGVTLPNNILVTDDLKIAAAQSHVLLLAVPSIAFRTSLQILKPHIQSQHYVVWATKGIEFARHQFMHEIALEIFGNSVPLAALSGPSFASEVAINKPTAITLACTDVKVAQMLAHRLSHELFRVYHHTDVIGTEIGGAVKNVLAIAVGVAQSLQLGSNAKAALITRGLFEIVQLGVVLGARRETLMGLAGLGDLVLTCSDLKSRNLRLGCALGEGRSVTQALADLGQVAEGYHTSPALLKLATLHKVELPICQEVQKILYEARDPKLSVKELLSRQLKMEY